MDLTQGLQVINIIVLVATAIILWVTAHHLKRYTKATVDQTELQSRPYLSLSTRSPTTPFGTLLKYYLRNHGQSTALNIRADNIIFNNSTIVFQRIDALEVGVENELKLEKIIRQDGTELSGELNADEFRRMLIIFSGEEQKLFRIEFENLIQQRFEVAIKVHADSFLIDRFEKKCEED